MPFNQPDDSAIMARQARCIGAKAKTLVRTPGFSGHVMAVLPGVAYLSGRDEEILWLFQEGVPLHGRGILLSFPAGYLRPGQTFLMKGQVLRIGSDLAIDLGRAAEWTPDSPRPWQSGPLVRVNDLVRQLLGTISEATSDDDPGQVIRGLSSILNGSNAEPFSPESWQRPILAAVFGLMKHCLEEGLCEIEIRGRELIGLGPGLTPCGDDFLGGILKNLRVYR
jgi:hypothetical protein